MNKMIYGFLMFFVIFSLPAFGQTTFFRSPLSPTNALIRGVPDQEVSRYDITSSSGASWNKVFLRFDKILPGNPWNSANINTYFTNVRIIDNSGNVVVNSFNPSVCIGAVITNNLWDCEVVTNFVLMPSSSAEWRVLIDIPLASPMTFLRQGFIATTSPNVQITGAGFATIPDSPIQGAQRQVQDPPPQPSMNLSGSSPTGNIPRGATNVPAAQFQVAVGPGSGTVTFNALRIVVEKTGGANWTIGNINSDFNQVGVFDSIGNVLIPKFNPSTCADVVVMPNRWECTVPTSYSIPVATTRNFDMIFNVGLTGTATSLRVGFIPTLTPNTTLPGGGSYTFPVVSVLGSTRAIVSPSQPLMSLSENSPTGEMPKGVNDQVLTQTTVTMSASVGSATVNNITFMVTAVGTSWTQGNIDQDFIQIGVYDATAGTVVTQFNPSNCVQIVLTATMWTCTVVTSYVMSAGDMRTWNIILDVPPGATASSLQGSFEVTSGNVSLSAGGSTSLPSTRIVGAVRLINDAPLPDPIFSNGFEEN